MGKSFRLRKARDIAIEIRYHRRGRAFALRFGIRSMHKVGQLRLYGMRQIPNHGIIQTELAANRRRKFHRAGCRGVRQIPRHGFTKHIVLRYRYVNGNGGYHGIAFPRIPLYYITSLIKGEKIYRYTIVLPCRLPGIKGPRRWSTLCSASFTRRLG